PATLTEPRNISVQQSFHRILHSTPTNHAPSSPQPSFIRKSKFPFSSTPSMFKALGPRDMDILNSQEIVRLAFYVMKRSSIELADPVLCEKVHTEGEKKRASAASTAGIGGSGSGGSGASGALKQVSSIGSNRKGGGNVVIGSNTTTITTNNNKGSNIMASSIYLTKDFDIGNSVLHHRSKRPSHSLESVLSIATFCVRASKPSPSQARRTSAGSSSGGSGHSNNNSNSGSGVGGGSGNGSPSTAAMVGAKWLAKLGQVVFGGPCAQAGHSHHRRTRHSLDLLDLRTTANTNENISNSNSGTPTAQRGLAASTEKLCKHCSGAMTCLVISILREASLSSSTTDSALSGQGRGIGRKEAGDLPAPPPAAAGAARATGMRDSGFESGASGLELLGAQLNNIASDTSSSSSSLSPHTTASSKLPSSGTGTPHHGQSSHASSVNREGSPRIMSEDYRPRLKLKRKTRVRPGREGASGSTPKLASSPSPSGGSPYIVFDKSHQKVTVIRHPLELNANTEFSHQHQAGQDLYEEESEAGESDAWSPSSVLSDSLTGEFGLDVTEGGDWRSNMYASTGTRTPRVEDLDDDAMDNLPLGQRVKTRLERDLAEALGIAVLDEPTSSSSLPFIVQPTQLPPPRPVVAAVAVPLVSSIRRPSITGLGIHAPVRNSNGDNESDSDEGEEIFHQAIDHFIHPLSTSPHNHPVSPRTTTTAPLAIPGASLTPAATLTNAIESPDTAPSPTFLQPSPSNYSSPPSSPAPAVSYAALASLTTDEVVTLLLPSTAGHEEVGDNSKEGDAELLKKYPFYGVDIRDRVFADNSAQEVEESMRKAPPVDLGRASVLPVADNDDDAEEGRKEEEEEEEVTLEEPAADVVAPASDKPKMTFDNDMDSLANEVGDVDDVKMEVTPSSSSSSTTTTAAAEEDEKPTSTERRLSTLRYGGVGLHALTPSDVYIQDIEEAMQRPALSVDLNPSSDDFEGEEDESEEKVVAVPKATVDPTSVDDEGEDEDGETKSSVGEEDANEDEVQTDDEATNAATSVLSAIDMIEDESFATTEAKGHLATALRYGAVGLHGKTRFDEYAHEIEESIQRGAQAQAVQGEGVRSEEEGGDRRSEAGDEENRDAEAVAAEDNNDDKDINATNKPILLSISTSSVFPAYTLEATTDSSFNYSSSDNPDSYDSSNPSSPISPFLFSPSTPSTSQTAVQKELQDLRHASQRRRKIQLVDDVQRKKEQIDRIREQLERKTLGKIREQVSFWETKGVLEQKVIGAEEIVEEDDEKVVAEGGEGAEKEGGSDGDNGASESNKKPLGRLSLTQELLSGMKKSSGEPMSPGNSQSPGDYYSEMPQLAPRRSLPTSTSSSAQNVPPPPESLPSSAPEPSEMEAFFTDVD
ncbi:hypothetical protein BGZ47_000796, partial [Haplosporangium gracile]